MGRIGYEIVVCECGHNAAQHTEEADRDRDLYHVSQCRDCDCVAFHPAPAFDREYEPRRVSPETFELLERHPEVARRLMGRS